MNVTGGSCSGGWHCRNRQALSESLRSSDHTPLRVRVRKSDGGVPIKEAEMPSHPRVSGQLDGRVRQPWPLRCFRATERHPCEGADEGFPNALTFLHSMI